MASPLPVQNKSSGRGKDRSAGPAVLSESAPAPAPHRILSRSLLLLASIVGIPSIVFNLLLPTQAVMATEEGQIVVVVSCFVALGWLALSIYFARLYRSSWRGEPRFAIVLSVLMLDACRNVVESAFFALSYSGWIEIIPHRIMRLLWEPQVMIISRLLALATAMVILWLVMEGGFENLKLREQRSLVLEQRNRELQALQQLAGMVSGSLEVNEVLLSVCREIVETLAFRSTLFCLVDYSKHVIRGAAGYGVESALAHSTVHPLDGDDPMARVARRGEMEMIDSSEGGRRLLAPVQDSLGVVGVVEVELAGQEPDEHRLALLQSFLRHACTSIRNARLHERVLRDRERLNHLTSSLEQKNQQLESFVYMVSHDLKAPLVSIQGFLSLMDQECRNGLGEDGQFYLERVRGNASHLEALIRRLLDLSRTGKVENVRELVKMDVLANEILETVRPRLVEERITLRIQRPLPDVIGDSVQICQLFLNLVDNSIKYMGASGERLIEIVGEEGNEWSEFRVRDTGVGIPTAMQEKVFEPFQRGSDASLKIEGSGVGLAIVRKIVEGHGGRIQLEESGAGWGASFRLLLPTPGKGITGDDPGAHHNPDGGG